MHHQGRPTPPGALTGCHDAYAPRRPDAVAYLPAVHHVPAYATPGRINHWCRCCPFEVPILRAVAFHASTTHKLRAPAWFYAYKQTSPICSRVPRPCGSPRYYITTHRWPSPRSVPTPSMTHTTTPIQPESFPRVPPPFVSPGLCPCTTSGCDRPPTPLSGLPRRMQRAR